MRYFSICIIFLVGSRGNEINPDCSAEDLELLGDCEYACSNDFTECIYQCGDQVECQSECRRLLAHCDNGNSTVSRVYIIHTVSLSVYG